LCPSSFDRKDLSSEVSQFTELVIAAQPRLYSYTLALVPNLDSANEVLQEANRVMLENEHQYDPERDFLSWACGVVRYRVLAMVRDRGRDKLFFDSELVETIAEHSAKQNQDSEERRGLIGKCYEKLTEHQRMLLDLRYEPEASVASMAELLDRPASSISSSLTKIRRKLTDCVRRERGLTLNQEPNR
jgi:RNA polymerase sigma-70 factor (ECF subfamily)